MRGVLGYYAAQSPDLADRFKRTFFAAVDELSAFPGKYPVKLAPAIRTRLMRPFPFLAFYAIEHDVVFVLTVQYAGPRPAYLRAVARERELH